MRPKIPKSLRERAENVVDAGGYASVGELVRDGVRERVNELERRQAKADIAAELDREASYSIGPDDIELRPVDEADEAGDEDA